MTKQKRLLELDCLRGIAALMVVIFHFGTGEREVPLNISRYGCTGVDLFFMISGFVIFLTLNKTNNYKDFLISRFARLYPAYWVCVSITFTLMWLVYFHAADAYYKPEFRPYLINLTMLQFYLKAPNLDGPYWTLIIELLFYVFMLGVLLLKKLNRIEDIGLGMVLLSITNELLFKKHVYPLYYALSVHIPVMNHIPLFVAGIIFYKIKFEGPSLKRWLIIGLCVINQIGLYNYAGATQLEMTRIEYMAFIVLFYAIFILYSYNKLGFIINRPLLYLGQISYSLYLIHQYISLKILLPFLTSPKGWHLNYWVAAFGVVLPLVIIIATLINRFIEVPAMVYIKRKWK